MNLTKMNFARLRLLKRSILFVSVGALVSCSQGGMDHLASKVDSSKSIQLAAMGQNHLLKESSYAKKAAPPIEIARLKKTKESYLDETRLAGESKPQIIASQSVLAGIIQNNFPIKFRYALEIIPRSKENPEDDYHIMNVEDAEGNPQFFLAKTAFDGKQNKEVFIRVQLFQKGGSLFARNDEQSYTQILYCKDESDLLSVTFGPEERNSRVDVFCYDSQEDLDRGNISRTSFRETTIPADR